MDSGTSTVMSAQWSDETADEFVPVVPFGLTPAHLLGISSLPFCIGAYTGYQREVERAAKEEERRRSKPGLSKAAFLRNRLSADGRLLAARALGIGTLLSVGGFGMICAGAFYASGHRSWGEAVTSMRRWGRRRRNEIEDSYAIDLGFRHHPDHSATRRMTEEEEWEYLQNKYLSNVTDNTQVNGSNRQPIRSDTDEPVK